MACPSRFNTSSDLGKIFTRLFLNGQELPCGGSCPFTIGDRGLPFSAGFQTSHSAGKSGFGVVVFL